MAGFDLGAGASSKASYSLEISWSGRATGIFTIGTSLIGSLDVLGDSPFEQTFGGPYDDLSAFFERGQITRGRDDRLGVVNAGSATFTCRDPDGLMNPRNTNSPVEGLQDDRLHMIRLVATQEAFPGFESLFVGWARRITWEPNGRRGTAQIEAIDSFFWLDRARPILASIGDATTTGAVINRILDTVGFPKGTWRRIATGDTIPDFTADGSQTALELIQGLLQVELGVFYFSKAGEAVYESRHARNQRTTLYTIENDLKAATPAIDVGQVKNRVRVRRTQNNYLAEAADSASFQRIGWSDLPEISTAYIGSNAQADALAAWLLKQVRQPRSPLYGMRIDHRTETLLRDITLLELVDRIRVKAFTTSPLPAPIAMDADYFVEQIVHTIDLGGRRTHTLEAVLSVAEAIAAFTIGLSKFPASRRNEIVNPSFEVNIVDGWAQFDNGVPSMAPVRDPNPTHALAGEASLQIDQTAAGQDDYLEATVGGLKPSTAYTFSAYVDARAFVAGAISNRGVHGFDQNDAVGTVQTATLAGPNSGYQRLSVTITTTATLGPHVLALRLYSPQGTVRYDQVMLEQASVAGDYFDGSSPGATWDGTAHNSASQILVGGDVLAY